MIKLQTTVADEINAQHRLAVHHADSAIGHAKRAGELLAQVKASMPHGAFLAWVSAHVEVSPRQAQRYMAAAQGRALPVRAIKNDTASHLPRCAAAFEPVPDCAMLTKDGDRTFIVEQSAELDHYFVSAVELIGDDDAAVDYLRRPIRGDCVESALQRMGMTEPSAAAWRIAHGCRVVSALGAQQ